MEHMSFPTYPGKDLDLHDSFRLIELQPGKDEDSIIVHLLSSRLSESPSFEALSYVWGYPDVVVPIKVVVPGSIAEFIDLPITTNCYMALKRLREPDTTRMLWIDAIAINQHLIPERNHQLGLISQIYSRATRVVVYLGELADDSDTAMDWIRNIDKPDDFETSPHYSDKPKYIRPDTTMIQKLLDRRWFTRVWVLQEIRFARDAIVVCGDKEVSWESFKAFRYWNRNAKWVKRLPYVVQWSVIKIDISYSRKLFLSPYPRRLLKKLDQTRNIEATDPRDKVFAILPLLDWEEYRFNSAKLKQIEDARRKKDAAEVDGDGGDSRESDKSDDDGEAIGNDCDEDGRRNQDSIIIQKDYNMPTAQIFTNLAQNLIDILGLEVLRKVITPTVVAGMPSWVPDWSANLAYPFIGRSRRAERGYSSRGFSDIEWDKKIWEPVPRTWHFSEYTPSSSDDTVPHTQLHVRAVYLGTITKLGDMANIYENHLPIGHWESLIRDEHPEFLTFVKRPYPGPNASYNEKHQWDIDQLPRFVRALAGDEIVYTSAINEAIRRIKDYTGDEPASETHKTYWYDDWRDDLTDEEGKKIKTEAGKDKPKMLLKDILKSMGVSYEGQAEAIFYNCHGRRFFVTETGQIGFAPETAEVGDQIVVIEGVAALFVVRPLVDDRKDVKCGVRVMRLIREGYVQGLDVKRGWARNEAMVTTEEMIIR
jgi:hypothetical protein